MTSSYNGAFYGCTSLASVEIPSSVTTIGGSAFVDCTSLVSVEIPSSVTTIGYGAFYGCTSLISVTVPKSVTSIGQYAFGYLSNKPIVYYAGSESDKAAATGGNHVGGRWVYNHERTAMRLDGDNAYGTMTSIVDTGWASSGTVILATFDGYWDALAASGLAGIYGCPVLLTDTNSLSPAAQAEISRLGARTVVIVGGIAAVSAGVEAQVRALGCSVERYAGDNAIATAVQIYGAGAGKWGRTCVVATVNGYYDALSASPYAYAKNAPIFLANADGSVSDAVAAAIREGGFTRVVVAGGVSCVTDAAASALAASTGAAVDRRAGENCFGTSVALANLCLADGMTMASPCFATGLGGYWDALTGGAFAGRLGSPLLLVDEGYENAVELVKSSKSSASQPYIFGGTAAVSASTEAKINAAVK